MPAIDWQRLKWYAVLAIGAGFTIAGIYIAIMKDSGGWFVAIFFLFCAAMAFHELWPQLVEGKRRYDMTKILRRFPGPVRLRVPQRKLIYFFFCFIAFGTGLLWAALQPEADIVEKIILWVGILGIAVAMPIFAMMILWGSSLRLDGEGFDIIQGFKRNRTLWRDASEFSIVDANVLAAAEHMVVMFDNARTKDGMMAGLGRRLVGHSSGLPDNYGMELSDLAFLMNEWRTRALAASPTEQHR